MCVLGVEVGLLRVVPSFASWFAILLPNIPLCALTLCIVMLCLLHSIWSTMVEISGISGWLC